MSLGLMLGPGMFGSGFDYADKRQPFRISVFKLPKRAKLRSAGFGFGVSVRRLSNKQHITWHSFGALPQSLIRTRGLRATPVAVMMIDIGYLSPALRTGCTAINHTDTQRPIANETGIQPIAIHVTNARRQTIDHRTETKIGKSIADRQS